MAEVEGRKKHGWFSRLTFGTAALAVSVLLFLSYVSVLVNPAKAWFFTLFGLLFVPLLLLTLLFFVWAIIRRSRMTGFLLVMLLPAFFLFGKYYQFKRPEPEREPTLKVVSYNVGLFAHGNEGDRRLVLADSVASFLRRTDADIICLQEFYPKFIAYHKEWFDSTGYQSLQFNTVAVLSRLPFLGDTIHINYPTRSNHSLACWIDLGGDSLLIINNHLESNHLSPEERDEYTNAITDPNRESIKSSSRKLMSKLSEAAAYRGAQTDSICAILERYAGHPTIVCGDLNDTPISYTYQRLSRRLTSAYREAGFGPGFTFSRRSFPVHIDHLFFSNHWTCTSCNIDRTVLSSDHYPLIVRLSKKEQ